MLCALGARVVVSERRRRAVELAVEELITGYYETSLAPDELIVEVRVSRGSTRAVYRKFRSRSHEDRPCVSVAAVARGGELAVVVGAVAGTPAVLPDAARSRPVGRSAARSRPRSATATRRRSSRSPTCAARPRTGAASSPSRCGAPSRSWRPRSDPDLRDGLRAVLDGTLRYAQDQELPGMLHGRILRSPYPHARDLRVDAAAVPRGVVVLTPDDVRDLAGSAARSGPDRARRRSCPLRR